MDTIEKILSIALFSALGIYILLCIAEFVMNEIDNYNIRHSFDDHKKVKYIRHGK